VDINGYEFDGFRADDDDESVAFSDDDSSTDDDSCTTLSDEDTSSESDDEADRRLGIVMQQFDVVKRASKSPELFPLALLHNLCLPIC
jgi:hypothetical protein